MGNKAPSSKTRTKAPPKLSEKDHKQKYLEDNPIGSGVSLESTTEGFYIKKQQIVTNKSLIKASLNRNITKESNNVYEVNDELFNSQKYSLDASFGIPQVSYMLGINSNVTEQKSDNSLVSKIDYKYVLTKTEMNELPSKYWELSTPNFKTDVELLTTPEATVKFVSKYGTHIITRCDYGYRFRKVFQTKKESVKSVNDFRLDSQLRVMEYAKINMNYTSKKVTNYNVNSKENDVLILGDKNNVLTRMRGDVLPFHWNTQEVSDSEVIDVYPQNYLPIWEIIPKDLTEQRTNLQTLTKEIIYELASGWKEQHTYCCTHLEMDPKFFFGEFILDLQFDFQNDKQRIITKSARLQNHHIEFLDQETIPGKLVIECNKWKRIHVNHMKLTVYYKDEKTYKATINNFNNFVSVDNNNLIRVYPLDWELIPLEELAELHPNENDFF